MKKFLSILAMLLLLVSCERSKQNYFNLSSDVNLYVNDAEGNNLLDPSFENGIGGEDIFIYYIKNGKEEEVFHGNYDYPRNFRIAEMKDIYCMTLWLNSDELEKFPKTIIQWSESDRDTIQASFNHTEYSSICSCIWLNDSLVWAGNPDPRNIYLEK